MTTNTIMEWLGVGNRILAAARKDGNGVKMMVYIAALWAPYFDTRPAPVYLTIGGKNVVYCRHCVEGEGEGEGEELGDNNTNPTSFETFKTSATTTTTQGSAPKSSP